jgi:hypothetical protein
VIGEKHALPRDEIMRKVSKTNMGDGGKAHTSYRREGEKK